MPWPSLISGVMFHFNCENDDIENITATVDQIGIKYATLLKRMEWVSLGGGIYFTKDGYPLEKFCRVLKNFSEKYGVQVYLEPGEAAITRSTELVTTVLDIVHNEVDIAIVDCLCRGAYARSPDLSDQPGNFIPRPGPPPDYDCRPFVSGWEICLAATNLDTALKIGDEVRISDAAGYTMVKKNWFNGLQMPSIAVRRLNGTIDLVRSFEYKDYMGNLS